MSSILGILSAFAGFIVFGGAYYIHQRVRMTRFACVMAAAGGFMTYGTATGQFLNRYAATAGVICGVAVLVGVAIIIADVKGKKKGADKPALFAFFLVPIFVVAGLTAVSGMVSQTTGGLQSVTSNMSVK